MAKLIRKNDEPVAPEPHGNSTTGAAVISFMIAILSVIIFITSYSLIALAVGLIAGLVFAVSVAFLFAESPATNSTSPAKRYGDLGERKAGFILEQSLPDDYTVIQNITVTYKGETSEIDNIVIGKTGVFIVEVKSIKGTVTGNYKDHDWLQNKTDQYGNEHKEDFYNPVKQVGTHIYRLANYLRDNKISTHINGVVYFVNPETRLTVKGEPNDIPVFTYRSTSSLIDYISRGKANLSEKTIQRIISLLLQ